MKTRQEMIASLPTCMICAECGVFDGTFSRDILRTMMPSMMHMVDTFAGEAQSADQDGKNRRFLYMPVVEKLLRDEFNGRPDVSIHARDSVEWLRALPDGWLDFVYIDTTHSYEQTKAELRESMRVVRPGGWISGHDYHERFPGVIQAVNELGLPFQLTEDGLPSYLIQRPQ